MPNCRQLVTWLSEADAVKLFKAAIEAPPEAHFEIVYGVSNNTRKKIINRGNRVYFKPSDDAELYREQVENESAPEDKVAKHFHGGPFAGKFFNGNLTKTLDSKLEDEPSESLIREQISEENPLTLPRSKL